MRKIMNFLYFIPLKQPEVVKRDIRFARQLRIASKVKVTQINCLLEMFD